PRPDPGRCIRPGRRPLRRLRVLPLGDPGVVPCDRDPEPDPDDRPGQPVNPDLGEPTPPRRWPRCARAACAKAEHRTDRPRLRSRRRPNGPPRPSADRAATSPRRPLGSAYPRPDRGRDPDLLIIRAETSDRLFVVSPYSSVGDWWTFALNSTIW